MYLLLLLGKKDMRENGGRVRFAFELGGGGVVKEKRKENLSKLWPDMEKGELESEIGKRG